MHLFMAILPPWNNRWDTRVIGATKSRLNLEKKHVESPAWVNVLGMKFAIDLAR